MRVSNISEANSFHPAVQRWFDSSFSQASPPQEQGWPVIAAGKHTLILAPTGSGKTLAAFLWCIDHLFRKGLSTKPELFLKNPDGVHTLYISPLKALNYDIHRNLEEPLKGIRKTAREMSLSPPDIRVAVRTGDTPAHIRQAMVNKPPQILITTPESLYLLITSPKGRQIFRHLQYLIVDEIHSVSNSKRGVHLSLSIERLMALCKREPVRIGLSATQKPLVRIAAFLGGQKSDPETGQLVPRPVTIVDCGQRKDLDLKVIAPLEDYGDLPDFSVWPAVYQKLYDLICQHRTTLVFVNMRAQTEKIARELNRIHQENTGDPNAEISLAHHGSISREARFVVEQRLKEGKIPAVIATASLELGIDIGSVELVVQVESPRSVTSALQRVGRSGHLLHATSKGRIIPMYPADLDDAVAITKAMFAGDIEETIIPENCLDVLAQQITAEVALQEWGRSELLQLVRQSYCYRNLAPAAFDRVLDMLAGRYADAPLQTLQPRITWDKVNNRLIPRRGIRLQALMNAGTIPDRGYYGVYLADSQVKLGDMEEEFVFESRVGDAFFLGNNEWRIDEIAQDRIIVSPLKSARPRPPFWKGGILFRDFSTQNKIGVFRREFFDSNRAINNSVLLKYAEPAILTNLQTYFQRQQQHTGKIPADLQVVVESFRDMVNEPQTIIHAPFGARVNGAWAIALNAFLEKKYGAQIQYDYDDDGIIIRMLDTAEPPDLNEWMSLSMSDIENELLAALVDTPVFSIYFRYNAMRALLLERSRKGYRIPLWLQRLRAADLLQVVRKFPDFPVVVETYRECLQDLFDLNRLRQVIEDIHAGKIAVHFIATASPSPMASGLLFRFLAHNLYENDQARYPGQAAQINSELLAGILNRKSIPAIVTREIVTQQEMRWQHLAEGSKATDKEELFDIIEQLGPINENEIGERTAGDFTDLLKTLAAENRILLLSNQHLGWVSASETLFFGTEANAFLQFGIEKFLRSHGPVTIRQIQESWPASRQDIQTILDELIHSQKAVHGQLVMGEEDEQYCNRDNFALLYRKAIAQRRANSEPVEFENFYKFSLLWHKVGEKNQDVLNMVRRYRGMQIPVKFFEREILRSRYGFSNPEEISATLQQCDELIAAGEIIVRAVKSGAGGQNSLQFFLRGEGHLFFTKAELLQEIQQFDEATRKVFAFLAENGASLVRDIAAGTRLPAATIETCLAKLVQEGLVTGDHYAAVLSFAENKRGSNKSAFSSSLAGLPVSRIGQRERPGRSEIKKRALERISQKDGRWFLTTSFAVYGSEGGESAENYLSREKSNAASYAKLLLARYGVVVKEWHRKEPLLSSWYPIFQQLKRLEWQGEIRRGYFIRNLSGVQFALPEAVDILSNLATKVANKAQTAVLLSVVDPALPFGGAVSWDLRTAQGETVQVVRAIANHLIFLERKPVVYAENYGARLVALVELIDRQVQQIANCLKIWLLLPVKVRPRKRIEIEQIDNEAAFRSQYAGTFLQNGFEKEGEKLVLWPSRIDH